MRLQELPLRKLRSQIQPCGRISNRPDLVRYILLGKGADAVEENFVGEKIVQVGRSCLAIMDVNKETGFAVLDLKGNTYSQSIA